MRFVALLVIVSIAVMISVTNGKPAKTLEVPADQPCEVEPKASKTYRLELVDSIQDFAGTKTICEGKGGHLMEKTISKDNKAVNHDEIMKQIANDPSSYWIGVTKVEGSWVGVQSVQSMTLDATKLLEWDTDRPTSSGQNCARLDFRSKKVKDAMCSFGSKGICEKEQ